jgi:membrane protease YdiL (CAAX protease family)
LGEELGWRGFLLPTLEPLGQKKAIVITSIIWALWHTPLILILGFLYGTQFIPGVFVHFFMVTGFGLWMGSVWFATRSTFQSAFMHGVFNAHAYGVWTLIFVSQNKLLIGPGSFLAAGLMFGFGVYSLITFNPQNPSHHNPKPTT